MRINPWLARWHDRAASFGSGIHQDTHGEQMPIQQELWHKIELPPWGDHSPAELLDLFARYCSGEQAVADRMSRLLMHVVEIQFSKHSDWTDGLTRIGLRSDHIAQDALLHLLRKSQILWSALRHHDQPKVLLAALNTSIYRFVLQEIAGVRRKKSSPISATDLFGHEGACAHGAFGGVAAPESHDDVADQAMEDLLTHLLECEDDLVGNIPVRGERSLRVVCRVYYELCRNLAEGKGIVPHRDLPSDLRRDIGPNFHTLLSTRIARAARRFAGAT